jgi:hypothetical protein
MYHSNVHIGTLNNKNIKFYIKKNLSVVKIEFLCIGAHSDKENGGKHMRRSNFN